MAGSSSRKRALSFTVAILMSFGLCLSGTAFSDPNEITSNDGVTSVAWDFTTASEYTVSNVSLMQGDASLSLYESAWRQESAQDFLNGSSAGLNISATGDISLSTTGITQLLGNGNFTSPDYTGDTDIIDNWTYAYKGSFDFWEAWQRRVTVGGIFDDQFCWKNHVMEPDPTQGFNASVWLNQSFNVPSVPISMNISAFHNFQNNTYAIDPGNIARMLVTKQSTNDTTIIYDTGYTNQSYPGYRLLWSNEALIFNESGQYTLTLFTYTDSNDNVADTSNPNGIDNYWDNASVTFNAYRDTGTFVSEVFDAGSYAMWKNISWSEDLPFGTNIEVFVRTGNSSVPTDSIWSDWSAPLTDAASSLIDRPWGRYVQYMANFTTQYTNVTPLLRDVNITYDRIHPTGTIETEDFLPGEIMRWGYFTYLAESNGQTISFWYSTNSGLKWVEMMQDSDLREVPITASGIRIRATLGTSDTVVTPVLMSMYIEYTSLFPSMTLETAWDSDGASPGQTTRLLVHFNNTAPSRSTTAWLNVYLDEKLEYVANNTHTVTSFDSYISDATPGIQKFVFSEIHQSTNSFWIDASVRPGTKDGEMLQTTVTLEYLGPLGKRVESLLEIAPLRVNGPVLTTELVALNSTGDVGDVINYEILLNNTGRGLASKVWLNGTLDDRFEGENISLVLENITGNSGQVIPFNVTLKENVVQGSSIPMSVSVRYADSAGFMAGAVSDRETVNALLRSRFDLTMLSQSDTVNSSEMIVLTVYFNNSGYGSAESINFEFTIPEGLEFISSSEECLVSSGKCLWEQDNVGPGSHSFTLTLRAEVMEESIYHTADFHIIMQVTDPVDGIGLPVASNDWAISINRIYTVWEKIYWPWSGLAATIGITLTAFGLWYIFKPIPPSIDDAFVLYKDGRLLSHRRSRNKPKSELDGDLVGAMLTAVQQFISDSLSDGREGKVKKLEFGDRELFLERGTNINIALVYSGSMNKKLQAQVQQLTAKIESDHPNLESWDGRMTELADIHAQVDVVIDAWQETKTF